MSTTALRWAFGLPIKGAAKAVLLALADHADAANACFPSIPRVALFAGTSDRGARKAIRELEHAGLIRTAHAAGNRSRYELLIGDTPELSSAPTPEPRSAPDDAGPRNYVPPTPEPGSGHPGTTCRTPRNQVPPNHYRTTNEPPGNHHWDIEQHDTPSPSVATKANGKRRKPETQLPADWNPTPEGAAYAIRSGIAEPDIGAEVAKFTNWHQANDKRRRDWSAAWRHWCDNYRAFGRPAVSRATPSTNHGGLMGALRRSLETDPLTDDGNA